MLSAAAGGERMPDAETGAGDPAAAYAAAARYYDLDYGELRDDIEMYQQFARRGDGNVLELGAGTGRIAVPLAEAGQRVVAVDGSEAMLAAGEQRMRDAGVEMVTADIRRVRLARRFGLVLLPFSTFHHMLTREDQIDALASVAEHLIPEGVAIIDLRRPQPDDFDDLAQPLRLEWARRDPRSGRQVTKMATQASTGDGRLVHLTYLYDEIREDGTVERVLARFPLRAGLLPDEVTTLCERAGLAVVDMYGSYELAPVGAGERLIVVARLADPPS